MFIIFPLWKTLQHPAFSSLPFVFFSTHLLKCLTFSSTSSPFIPLPFLIWPSQRPPGEKNPISQIQWLLCCPHSLNLATMVFNNVDHFFFLKSLFFNFKMESISFSLFFFSACLLYSLPWSSFFCLLIVYENSNFCSVLALRSFSGCFQGVTLQPLCLRLQMCRSP